MSSSLEISNSRRDPEFGDETDLFSTISPEQVVRNAYERITGPDGLIDPRHKDVVDTLFGVNDQGIPKIKPEFIELASDHLDCYLDGAGETSEPQAEDPSLAV